MKKRIAVIGVILITIVCALVFLLPLKIDWTKPLYLKCVIPPHDYPFKSIITLGIDENNGLVSQRLVVIGNPYTDQFKAQGSFFADEITWREYNALYSLDRASLKIKRRMVFENEDDIIGYGGCEIEKRPR